MAKIKLIVGLGNPGKQYELTRHNAGFWLVDQLVANYSTTLQHKDKYFGWVGSAIIDNEAVYLLKPETFMNLSGKSVQALASFYRITAEQILVAHDELDIPCGNVRLKTGGGHGGHNGLRDVIKCGGGQNFHRLRIGIDHPGHASQVTGYVLHKPSLDERISINLAIDKVVDNISTIVCGDFETAMQTLHTKV